MIFNSLREFWVPAGNTLFIVALVSAAGSAAAAPPVGEMEVRKDARVFNPPVVVPKPYISGVISIPATHYYDSHLSALSCDSFEVFAYEVANVGPAKGLQFQNPAHTTVANSVASGDIASGKCTYRMHTPINPRIYVTLGLSALAPKCPSPSNGAGVLDPTSAAIAAGPYAMSAEVTAVANLSVGYVNCVEPPR